MDHALGFDPALPELPLPFDLNAVARLFEQRWPGRGSTGDQPLTVRRCRLQDVKYRPSRGCVTVYELLVEQPGGQPTPTIGVIELGPGGPALRLYDEDPQLPWLAEARDPAAMGRRFGALLGADLSCAVSPVRYKPGARCVFRYELETPAGPRVYFGKLLAGGGEQLAATIAALHQTSEREPLMPRIPRPLVFWPDLHMLVQPGVEGSEQPATRERWLHEAGACLAALHTHASIDAARRSLADDLDELREYVAPMALANPAQAARYEQALAFVAAGVGQDDPSPVATHGAFRTDQLMIQGSDLVLIDLDTFCLASPARDVGNFMAYLRWKAIRRPEQQATIEQAGLAFLAGYQAARPELDARQLARYQAASLLKIAGRRFRSLTVKEWPLVPRLIDAALSM
jgi:hypothetical protein